MILLHLHGPVEEITKGTGYFSFSSAAGNGGEACCQVQTSKRSPLANPIFRTVVADSNIHELQLVARPLLAKSE
jgi:hypothetical protein